MTVRTAESAPPSRPRELPSWLPASPRHDAGPVRLHVPSAWAPERVAVEGLPAADLFLLAWRDPDQAAWSRPGGHVVTVLAGGGAAVDLAEAAGDLPADRRHLAAFPGAYLLPGAGLDRTRLVEGCDVDGAGRVTRRYALPPLPLALRCAGARHGVDGLPEEVVRWPRRPATAYAAVAGPPVADHLPLHPDRPAARPGHRLVRFRLAPGAAIDVAATAERLAPLSAVRSRAAELLAAGVALLLPRESFGRVPVTGVFDADGDGWRRALRT